MEWKKLMRKGSKKATVMENVDDVKKGWSGMEESGVGWGGRGWSGVEESGVGWGGRGWSGVGWRRVEWSGVEEGGMK